ncbi:MAG: Na/Pi cotransporter family protein, partial [Bacillota bacterium]|nr:Na/Pi cotransporter family protein [Bacillota bacterium]
MKMFFTVAGGLGLFLYGMQLMGDGLQKAAGDRLRRLLEILTGVPIIGVFVGALVTVLVQSSSATTVMVVGFVNAGLMSLAQAISVILGANIGTTITAQMVSFKLTDFALPAIAIGFLLTLLGRSRTQKQIGQVVLGFGVLFLGMMIMSDGLRPLRTNPLFKQYMIQFGAQPLLGVFAGLVFTAAIQSSSAFTGLVISLALQDLIGLDAAITMILGSNIGTCITAMLAAIGTNLTARRAALAHVLFNVMGVFIFLPFVRQYTVFVAGTADTLAHQAANAHTFFNIVNTVIVLPFIKPFARLITRLLPGDEGVVSYGPKYLDAHLLGTPSVALGQATKELIRMGEIAVAMLDDVHTAFKNGSREHMSYAAQKEASINALEHDIVMYLVKISQRSLSDEQSRRLNKLLNIVNDLERVGDHAENLQELAEYRLEHKLPFSAEGIAELDDMHSRVRDLVQSAIQALEEDDIEIAKDIIRRENEIDQLEKELRRSHINRLNESICHPSSGIVFLD